jgi:hypothetical protein
MSTIISILTITRIKAMPTTPIKTTLPKCLQRCAHKQTTAQDKDSPHEKGIKNYTWA